MKKPIQGSILLHAADAARRGCTIIMVRTVDTDVVVIRVVAKFQYISLSERWIEVGVGKHLKHSPVHDMTRNIGEEKSQALLLHNFSLSLHCSFQPA